LQPLRDYRELDPTDLERTKHPSLFVTGSHLSSRCCTVRFAIPRRWEALEEMYYYYYYLTELQMASTRWQWYYNKTQHTKVNISHKITQHSTQSYTNNIGHITHKEYNDKIKSRFIPVTGREGPQGSEWYD
jgi:hypothetical protein